jgi:hypothetical protein
MRATLDSSGAELTIQFGEPEEAGSLLEELRAAGGFLAELDRELELYRGVRIRLVLGNRVDATLEASVAQAFPAAEGIFKVAFLVADWSDSKGRTLEQKLGLESSGEETPGTGEFSGVSPIHQLKQMNPNQKAHFAKRAGRSERQILLRDNSAQVLQGLLFNPRIEAKEILQIVKSTHVNAPILQRIVGDARWGKNQEILAQVVRNPKTPTVLATRLVEKLRTSDLRTMAKMSSGLKETLRRVALREYLRRSSQ